MKNLKPLLGLLAVWCMVFFIVTCSTEKESERTGGGGEAGVEKAGQPEGEAVEEPAGKPAEGAGERARIEEHFKRSLHHTGEGMRYFYEAEDGFMAVTGIPYKDLGCKNCHAKSCDDCHGEKKNGKTEFSAKKPHDNATCYKCHARAAAALKLDRKNNTLGVHKKCDLACTKCHKVHSGDPETYFSMRQPGAVPADCILCHKAKGESPGFDADLRAHKKHGKKLHCNACHVSNTISCYNCHFDEFLRTKTKKGNFLAPVKNNVLLLNYKGKVTSGIAMTMVYKKKKFVAFAPYFTHSIREKGRACSDCHGIEAAKLLRGGKAVPVVSYADGRIEIRKGVIPVVPDLLRFTYFDKVDGKWTPLPNDTKPLVQFAGFGEPLSTAQIKKLARKVK